MNEMAQLNKQKPDRNPVLSDTRRTRLFRFRLSEAELSEINSSAEWVGESVSAFVRRSALDDSKRVMRVVTRLEMTE